MQVCPLIIHIIRYQINTNLRYDSDLILKVLRVLNMLMIFKLKILLILILILNSIIEILLPTK